MDATIFSFLLQDAATNGAIYALLALALVLVFAVTRILFIPQGEFVAFGALTYAMLEIGVVPGTVWLLLCFGLAAFAVEMYSSRRAMTARKVALEAASKVLLPAAIAVAVILIAPSKPGPLLASLLTVVMVAPMGPYLYRFAFQPMAEASILVLFIAAVAIHLALTGLSLVFFGPEGLRASPLSGDMFEIGPLLVTGQSLSVYALAIGLMGGLYLFFSRTLWGKALAATAVNRLGARLVGIPTTLSGKVAFTLAAAMGAVSGVLLAPMTTVYYDTGFIIGLKGFIAAIIGGLVSFPLAAAAALGVGLVEAFASFYASPFKEIIVFMLIIPVLIWRSLVTHHVEDEEE
ncbi:MAG: branched-chain amino acid ABC transporter permease [Rhodospirillales bacterium]|nr:branched-chain amino acid ABC transporter permease [Rhodospirillales bacterium]